MTTQLIDPYPEDLAEDLTPLAEPDPLVRAVNRLAQAVEQNTLALLDRAQPAVVAPQTQRPALAPLPAVTIVAQKPPCPHHGIDKVQESRQFAGFFCSAKASPGQPQNARGYCTWQFRTQA